MNFYVTVPSLRAMEKRLAKDSTTPVWTGDAHINTIEFIRTGIDIEIRQ